VHDWRRDAIDEVVTWSLVMVCTFFFGYGLDSLLGNIALERSILPWLAIGFRVFFHNYSIFQG
jgi:hypothetical protein